MDALQLAVTEEREFKGSGNGHLNESTFEMRLEALEKITFEMRLDALEKMVADLAQKLAVYSSQQALTPVENPEPSKSIRPSISKIKSVVCEFYGVTVTDLESQQRGLKIVWPRQIAQYLASRLTTKTFVNIGKHFGDRDHTTVLHARNKVAGLRTADEDVRNQLIALEARLS